MMCAALTAAMTLGELLGSAAGPHADILVEDLVLDSRESHPGAAFVAVAGQRHHGLEFAEAALERGATVVLYEPSTAHGPPPQPSVAVPGLREGLGDLARRFYAPVMHTREVLGVTGTNGKTTVAYLVAQALGGLGTDCGYIGTLGFGVPPSLQAHSLTTPDCLGLHREIALLGTPAVSLEVSSHGIEQDRIAGLTIQTAAFTNLSRDHLDAHVTLERYGAIKARLFEREGLATAVLNLDDPFAAELRGRIDPAVKVVGVGTSPAARAEIVAAVQNRGLAGLELTLAGAYGRGRLASALVGGFNAENLLVALGMLVASGRDLSQASAALAASRAAPGRMEVFNGTGRGPYVVVDYAHTPDALERVLDALSGLTPGELTCVFGCGGSRDRGKRPLMGAVAAARADRIVLTDDNPRAEDPAAIVADIRRGIGREARVVVEHDREAAIRLAVDRAKAGDTVLIAGRGHEAEQIRADGARPFDDRAVVAALVGAPS